MAIITSSFKPVLDQTIRAIGLELRQRPGLGYQDGRPMLECYQGLSKLTPIITEHFIQFYQYLVDHSHPVVKFGVEQVVSSSPVPTALVQATLVWQLSAQDPATITLRWEYDWINATDTAHINHTH